MQPITVILTEGFSDWEIALISGAGRLFFSADIRFVSPTGGPLTSAGGLVIADTAKLETCESGVLVICGGTIWDAADTPDISDVLVASYTAGATIAAICGGTLPAARAGLLNGVAHTSNGAGYLAALVPSYAGAGHYIAQPQAVVSGGIITAAGTAPVTFAAAVFAAAGLPAEAVAQFQAMLSAENQA
jgi:putative intracellular protease/amidase